MFPIDEVCYTDREKHGGYGPVTILLKNGDKKTVMYEGMEGNLQL